MILQVALGTIDFPPSSNLASGILDPAEMWKPSRGFTHASVKARQTDPNQSGHKTDLVASSRADCVHRAAAMRFGLPSYLRRSSRIQPPRSRARDERVPTGRVTRWRCRNAGVSAKVSRSAKHLSSRSSICSSCAFTIVSGSSSSRRGRPGATNRRISVAVTLTKPGGPVITNHLKSPGAEVNVTMRKRVTSEIRGQAG